MTSLFCIVSGFILGFSLVFLLYLFDKIEAKKKGFAKTIEGNLTANVNYMDIDE